MGVDPRGVTPTLYCEYFFQPFLGGFWIDILLSYVQVYHRSNRFYSAFVLGIALDFLSLEGIVSLVFVHAPFSCSDDSDADEPLQRLLASLIPDVHTCVLAIGNHRVSQLR